MKESLMTRLKLPSRRLGGLSVANVLVIAMVSILALLLYNNMGNAVGPARVARINGRGITGTDAASDPVREAVEGEIGELKSLAWDDTDSYPPFYIVDLERASKKENDTLTRTTCRSEVPSTFCDGLFEAPSRVGQYKSAKIFLVPIFQSLLFSANGLHGSVTELMHHRYFVKFRGSDFVFLCYTTDCESTRRAVLSALGRSVRAMWVDRSGRDDWPCANRKIRVSWEAGDLSWIEESRRIPQILRSAEALVQGRRRWSCDSMSTWDMHHPTAFDFGTIKDTSFKSVKDRVAYCGVPKVGSSVAVLLMRRMNGMKNWKKTNTVQIRNFHTGANWTFKSKDDMFHIFNETGWVKGMLVRNPISRLLSGYQSKVVQLREYNRVPGGWPAGAKPPTMRQFIGRIRAAKIKGNFDWMDRHIRPQSALCGVRTLPYDFIGHYEERQQDMHDFLQSLELWEKLGESGWGPKGLSSLYAEDEHIIRQNKPKPVTHADSKSALRKHYTRDLIQAVIHLYDEDFTRFGFSKNPDNYI